VSLHELVVDSAVRHPGRLAVQGPHGALTYAELDTRAGVLARRLAALGVRAGDRVLIWAAKSPEAVVAMQAVLRLGAAYVPAGDATPADRVAAMLQDCGARAVCTDAGRTGALPPSAAGIPVLDLSRQPAGSPSEPSPGPAPEPLSGQLSEPLSGPGSAPPPAASAAVSPDDLAYILYTSGSTGRPKGVCVSHANARAFVDWAVRELAATERDRFSSHAPFTFDLSVLDLYAAFAVGASVHLVPADLAYAPSRLVDFLHDREISVWYSVPTALMMMQREGGLLDRPAPPALRAVLFAGEPFPIDQLRPLADWTAARLLNLYGPTETNVCTFHEAGPADLARSRPVPIGRAASGDQVWAETPDGTAARPGQEGELIADGPTVMLGYWGHPPQRGPYRTGDIVQVREDGGFEFLGRRDHIVKIRGNRVGLAEVEAAVGGHPAVDQAAALVAGEGLDARLVCFVTPAAGDGPPTLLSVKRHCAALLPAYMLIDELRVVDALPRNANGKVDRAALAGRTPAVAAAGGPSSRT
jgi:amino acid adenylation domain-containing protein